MENRDTFEKLVKLAELHEQALDFDYHVIESAIESEQFERFVDVFSVFTTVALLCQMVLFFKRRSRVRDDAVMNIASEILFRKDGVDTKPLQAFLLERYGVQSCEQSTSSK